MATIQDIAQKTGVSSATVSRVINGSSKVSDKTRLKIIECMKVLNYQPNAVAQSLARNKSLLIGVIAPNIKNPFFGEIIENITLTAKYNGYGVILCDSDSDINKEEIKIELLKRRQVDGMLIVPVDKTAGHIRALKDYRSPVVIVTQELKIFDSISVSHIGGAEMVALHFVNLGFKKIGYVGLKKDIKYSSFKKMLNKYNIELKDNYHISCKGNQNIFLEACYATLKKVKNDNFRDIEAVFAYNDLAALGTMKALKDNGYKIPDDVAVAGFDNTFLSVESTPELTSIAQPVSEIGSLAVEMLLKRIYSGKNLENNKIILQPRLIERESTTGIRCI